MCCSLQSASWPNHGASPIDSMPFQHSGSVTQKLFGPSEPPQSVKPRGAGTCCRLVLSGVRLEVGVGVGAGVGLAVADGVVGGEVAARSGCIVNTAATNATKITTKAATSRAGATRLRSGSSGVGSDAVRARPLALIVGTVARPLGPPK